MFYVNTNLGAKHEILNGNHFSVWSLPTRLTHFKELWQQTIIPKFMCILLVQSAVNQTLKY